MTFTEMHVKWSVTLSDRLGLDMFTMSEIMRQVLHCVCLHLKVPGALSHLNVLLTRKLLVPMLLLQLNKISRVTPRNMYLLTEWEGRTGKYLARGNGVRTKRNEVRVP